MKPFSRFNPRSLALSTLAAALCAVGAGGAAQADEPAPPVLGGITADIPWSELRDLLRASWDAEADAGHPTGPAWAFGPAEVTAALGGGRLSAVIQMPVRTFRDGATLVKLFDGSPAIARAALDGAPAPLVVGDGSAPELPAGALGLVVPSRGEHRLEMELVAAAPEVPGPNATALPALPSPATTVELHVADGLSSVEVDGGVMLDTAPGLGGPGTVKAAAPAHDFRLALGGGASLGVRYVAAAPPEDPVAPGEAATPRVTATVNSMLEVGDGVLRLKAWIDFEISRAPITALRVALPDGYELVRCDATGLRRCATDEPGILKAELGYKVDKAFVLQLVLERTAAGDGMSKVAWPAVKVLDVEHEIGFLGVVAESGIEVRPGASKGILPLDVVELPPQLQAMSARPALLGFRYTRQPFELSLEITRHPSGEVLSSAVDLAAITLVSTEDGDSVGRAVYRVRNNRKQFLVVTLPKGAMIWNAFVAGEPVKPGESKPTEDGRPVYLVPLARSVGGAGGFAEAFDVEVIYFRDGAEFGVAGSVVEALPAVDLPVSEMQVYLYLPSAHDYLSAGGDLETPFGSGEGFLGFDALAIDGRFASMDLGPAGSAGPVSTPTAPPPATPDGAEKPAEVAGSSNMALDPIYRAASEGVLGLRSRTAMGGDAGAMARGVLPVKFVLPERGVMVPFTTALVLPGEAPQVYVRYGPSWVRSAASVVGAGAIMAGLVLIAAALWRARRQRRLTGADVHLWAGVATIFVACAVVLLAGGTLTPVWFAGFALAVGYGVLRWIVERRGRSAAAGVDAGGPPAPPTPPPSTPPSVTPSAPASAPSAPASA